MKTFLCRVWKAIASKFCRLLENLPFATLPKCNDTCYFRVEYINIWPKEWKSCLEAFIPKNISIGLMVFTLLYYKMKPSYLVFSNSSSFSWILLSISCLTWDSSSCDRRTLFSSCSRAASASSRAAWSSSFSTSSRLRAFSISWMFRPPSPIWSSKSLTSSGNQ